ncbi:hypothetical protein FOXG_14016 [Fusarium oxysporum f. sp. lycopersici 4287]|uniref:Zn(2)-C6 fungal-type domain-containing protein n=2 Tax=Fusarium oxysporum TaxID=5507 RepID=A0A0J9VXI8_FUSO4|nr:hypothetical protein FOXG_12523 [Fusarium oxysporum f. sp. lycopersici 4287]XP_018253526.1 hypothetical protein FOXG_14016 [Fusarium oxysporum f. sp. lycopersici 4287]EWZ79307.1 hypothetical protein FOWG_16580 [Fusarium oxysporum f. sp. lycopersici MN25]KNB13892.1 hypothetical protein FOXG_12523 [Fusarium oxysporum f. sp. lycopersici 4287]KNB15481.1 hypothetical protein FOXG_14016 [Fusarium oxysporum f. sp. lycopersici 4287]
MATSDTLPPIRGNGTHGSSPVALAHNQPTDPPYAYPNAVNGDLLSGQQSPPGQPEQYLPPLQPQFNPRYSAYPPIVSDQKFYYYGGHRPPYGQELYGTILYYNYYHKQPPPGSSPPDGHPGYRDILAGVDKCSEVGHGSERPMAQTAPRKRASIACRYCRKKRIRCSGYQSAPGGKCQNCARMNEECIFQPASSSSSTAFIPVSALPGGVPPGTQLFGAHGQPLALSTAQAPPQIHVAHQGAPRLSANYYGPVQSPAESLSSYGDPSADDGNQLAGRRRRRTSEEQDEGYRLPPPRSAVDNDPRRRSPAEFSNHSSPGGVAYLPYQGARQSRQNPTSGSLPQAATTGCHAASAPGGCSPTGQNGPSGAFTFTRQGQQPKGGNASIMSLRSLVDNSDKTVMDPINLGLANQADDEMSAANGIATNG